MPRHGMPTIDLTPRELAAVRDASRALRRALGASAGAEPAEERLQALLMVVGRDVIGDYLGGLGGGEPFEEHGVTWKPVLHKQKKLLTSFGWVQVERPLFRSVRNGPTRCLVSERAGLFQDMTPRAARLAALATAELPFGRAEALFRELGAMTPSATLLQRHDRRLLELWDQDRDLNEERLRRSCPIPPSAVMVVVSLDGVMVNMVGAERAKRRAQALEAGREPRGPTGYKEAAVGVVTLHDAEGTRLATWRMGRMPETNKATVKAWLQAELRWIRERVPGIRVVAAADGAPSNWAFLQTLGPDVEVVDYFHTVEYLTHELSRLHGNWSAKAIEEVRESKRLLLETKTGPRRVAALLEHARETTRKGATKPSRPGDKRKLTYFDHHRDRMNYAELRELNVPIGTGVTEGTCRYLVVDRLRRSGMTWSAKGGQSVLNLRALVVSDRFDAGWDCLVEANRLRLKLSA